MSIIVTLKICGGIYLIVILLDLLLSRRFKRFLFELFPLVLLIVVDILMASLRAGYLTFGSGSSPTAAVLIMFVSILCGIAARYLFYFKKKFSWLDFTKPLCISPILLLPLIGSIQAVKELDIMQLVSFALLAFQNGFFWQVVLERAQQETNSK